IDGQGAGCAGLDVDDRELRIGQLDLQRLGQTRALDGELAIGRWTDSGDLHFLRQGAPDALVGTRGRRLIAPGGQRSGQTALSARFVLDSSPRAGSAVLLRPLAGSLP